MFHKESIQFLKNLKKNNHKEWFEAHRSTYENARNESLARSKKFWPICLKKRLHLGNYCPNNVCSG
jgi:uncharacterized protein (DUF2461 family)